MLIPYPVKAYLAYWLKAVNAHSLHSPFIYELYTQVIQPAQRPLHQGIELIRKDFKANQHRVEVEDFGVGSKTAESRQRKISQIAKTGVTSAHYAAMMDRLISYFSYTEILELGTSIGLTTLYLSNGKDRKVTTMEGASSLLNMAKKNFKKEKRGNIQVVHGNIDTELDRMLNKLSKLDFVFFDANHRYEATIKYFECCLRHVNINGCFIFDDIHWSKPMEQAWDKIKQHHQVTITIDLFQMGMVFFNPDLKKRDYILSF